MSDQGGDKKHGQWLSSFVSLNWYEEAIKFIFNFVTQTSELLLAAGIVISTANFLTDGDVMSHNRLYRMPGHGLRHSLSTRAWVLCL